ncbi:MAG: hypothetical protein LBC74_15150 [Planctomycetaceae bacterium]|nr:hypothetical protein [Planctomycetaceae bacterium]
MNSLEVPLIYFTHRDNVSFNPQRILVQFDAYDTITQTAARISSCLINLIVNG